MPGSEPERHDESRAIRLGRGFGRLRRKVRQSQPDAEKATRAAIDVARPAAERGAQFLKEHEDEIKRAGGAGARMVIERATPPVLRPVVSAVNCELSKKAARTEPDQTERGPDDREHSGGGQDRIS